MKKVQQKKNEDPKKIREKEEKEEAKMEKAERDRQRVRRQHVTRREKLKKKEDIAVDINSSNAVVAAEGKETSGKEGCESSEEIRIVAVVLPPSRASKDAASRGSASSHKQTGQKKKDRPKCDEDDFKPNSKRKSYLYPQSVVPKPVASQNKSEDSDDDDPTLLARRIAIFDAASSKKKSTAASSKKAQGDSDSDTDLEYLSATPEDGWDEVVMEAYSTPKLLASLEVTTPAATSSTLTARPKRTVQRPSYRISDDEDDSKKESIAKRRKSDGDLKPYDSTSERRKSFPMTSTKGGASRSKRKLSPDYQPEAEDDGVEEEEDKEEDDGVEEEEDKEEDEGVEDEDDMEGDEEEEDDVVFEGKNTLKKGVKNKKATTGKQKGGRRPRKKQTWKKVRRDIKFFEPDSDEIDEEDNQAEIPKWAVYPDAEIFQRPPPTRPNPKRYYEDRQTVVRDHRSLELTTDGKRYWAIARILGTDRKYSREPKIGIVRDAYLKLARGNQPLQAHEEVDSQTLIFTPDTPPVVIDKDGPLTREERDSVETLIRQAGAAGIPIEGTDKSIVYTKKTKTNPWRQYCLRQPRPGRPGSYVEYKICCSLDHPGCLAYGTQYGVSHEEFPKCSKHNGDTIGFVLTEYTDDNNKKRIVVLHQTASFRYYKDDNESKETAATNELTWIHIRSDTFRMYKAEFREKNKNAKTVKLTEIRSRRLYFDSEDEMMKRLAARQTTTLFQMLLWPHTTIKIICLNVLICFPNGAYKELKEEIARIGLMMKIHEQVPDYKETDNTKCIPFIDMAQPGELVEAMINRVREEKHLDAKKEEYELAALYFVSSPKVIYAGQAVSDVTHQTNINDSVQTYMRSLPKGHSMPKTVVLGAVPHKQREKWEFHLILAAQIQSMLRAPTSINPEDFINPQNPTSTEPFGHPVCMNKVCNSSFVDKKSLSIICSLLKTYFKIDVKLVPVVNEQLAAKLG